MPIQSNLSISPYFDDYDYQNDYYRVMFKPSTAVQVRELNQMQAMLQRQIEEFGDVVLKRGTLLDGCQASFNTALPFAKVSDVTADGAATDVLSYINLFARGDTNGLVAHIINAIDGFEAQDPNLKTLYFNYLNGGNNSNTNSFEEGETLTIYNTDFRLYDIRVNAGSLNFSNSDNVIITPAIEVQNTAGGTTGSVSGGAGFFASDGAIVEDDTTGLKLEIIETVSDANTNAITLRVKPVDEALANLEFSTWAVAEGALLTDSNTGNQAIITRLIGSGASAIVETDRGGGVDNIVVQQGGSNYTINPHVSIASRTASEQNIGALSLGAENYKARVTIPDPDTSTIVQSPTVGVGYSMTVTSGKIYQKGHFLRVPAQNIIVSKYLGANSSPPAPDGIAVGFETVESFANVAVDPSLNDNAAGNLNQNAPGADRLKLVPRLAVKTFAQAENDVQFFPIYKFSEGQPYSQRTDVQFNKVADEMARRTYEESGNYVLNPFEITTRSPISMAQSNSSFTYLIDPGLAYVNGYRVETQRNFAKTVSKGVETTTVANTSLDLVYGNYIRVNEFAGLNQFTTANLIELHSSAVNAISGSLGVVSDPNSQIGTARVRSIVHETGEQGTSSAVYRVYLFDIRMQSGRNFKNVKSIHSSDGVADLILEAGNAVLKESKRNKLLFGTNRTIKSLSNIEYRYRTSKDAVTVTSAGRIEVTRDNGPANTDVTWPYAGQLTPTEKNELIVIPDDNIISDSGLTGTISASGTTVTGTSTSFTSQLRIGDYIVDDSDSTAIAQVTDIISDTVMDIAPSGALNGAVDISRIYPKNIPIPLAADTNTSAAISSDGTKLIIDLAFGSGSAETASLVYNQKITGLPSVQKNVNRKSYVKLDIGASNNTKGPWCLGVPDVFRLRAVYEGTTTAGADVTSEFYVDHGQTENYYDLSYLYQREGSSYVIDSSSEFLVEFDCFDRSADGGLFTINSYNINDQLTLDELTTEGNSINTLEIPEVASGDKYYDLREVFDFRPAVTNTAAITSNPAAASTNPPESTYSAADLFATSNIKFPIPEGDLFFDMTYYNARQDTIILNATGNFEFILGRVPREINANQFPLYRVTVPPYPSLPKNLSVSMEEIYDTKILSTGIASQRKSKFTIQTEELRKQVQGYTMEGIAQLERRIAILEYYTNLSETENRVKELSIPSSIDSSFERFKFGFYVDNFSDYQFSNIDDPEFRATIFEYILQPASVNYNIPLKIARRSRDLLNGKKLLFPYERVNLLSQTFATSGPKPKPPPVEEVVVEPPPDPAPQIPPWSRICQSVINRNQQWTRVDTPAEYAAISDVNAWTGKIEENIFTLTSNTEASGQSIDFFFDLGYGQDRIVIEQSTTPSFTNAVQIFNSKDAYNNDQLETLSAADRRRLRNLEMEDPYYPYPAAWDQQDYTSDLGYGPDGADAARDVGMISFLGKFSLTYDATKGRYLKVIIQKAGPFFLYHFCYPGDAIADPIYNTFGFADKFASDAPPPYGTGSSAAPVGPADEEDNIDPPTEGQKPPDIESPPQCIIDNGGDDESGNDSEGDTETENEDSVSDQDDGKDRGKDEEIVWTKPVEPRPPQDFIITTSPSFDEAVEQVDNPKPITFSDILFNNIKFDTR